MWKKSLIVLPLIFIAACSSTPVPQVADTHKGTINRLPASDDKLEVIIASVSRDYVMRETSGIDVANDESIKSDLMNRLQTDLYHRCVLKTKNEEKCEMLPETFQYNQYNFYYDNQGRRFGKYAAEMMVRYKKSDAPFKLFSKDKVFRSYVSKRFWDEANKPIPEAKIKDKMKEYARMEAMNMCILKSKRSEKCLPQEKTFSFDFAGNEVDPQTGVIYRSYDASYDVVWKKKAPSAPSTGTPTEIARGIFEIND